MLCGSEAHASGMHGKYTRIARYEEIFDSNNDLCFGCHHLTFSLTYSHTTRPVHDQVGMSFPAKSTDDQRVAFNTPAFPSSLDYRGFVDWSCLDDQGPRNSKAMRI